MGETAQQTLQLQVAPTNHAPELQSAFDDLTATKNQGMNAQLDLSHFNDRDGDALSYHITQADGSALPSWLNFDASTGKLE